MGEDLELGENKAKPDSNLTLNRAFGNALVYGSKPDTSNIPMGSLSIADASNAEAQTKQDDRLATVASAKNANASSDARPFAASTDPSRFQSPLTSAGVSNTFAEQELNDLLADIASAESVNASDAEAPDVRKHVKASNARTTNVPGSLLVPSKTKVKAFDAFTKGVLDERVAEVAKLGADPFNGSAQLLANPNSPQTLPEWSAKVETTSHFVSKVHALFGDLSPTDDDKLYDNEMVQKVVSQVQTTTLG